MEIVSESLANDVPFASRYVEGETQCVTDVGLPIGSLLEWAHWL